MKLTDFSTGTYVGCRPVGASTDLLGDWVRDTGIPNPVVRHAAHMTLLYSKKPVKLPPERGRELHAKPLELRIMRHRTDKTDALVLVLDSPAAQRRHQEFINAGGMHDYDDFIPHVTLTYDVGDFDWKSLELPKFGLIFANEYVRPLKPTAD